MTSYDDLERLLRERKAAALKMTADLGAAKGMRVGVEILRALAKGRKTINTREILDAAQALETAAAKLDAKATAALKGFEPQTEQEQNAKVIHAPKSSDTHHPQ